MRWLLSNASSKDIIDCLLKGKRDTKMFKNNFVYQEEQKLLIFKRHRLLAKG